MHEPSTLSPHPRAEKASLWCWMCRADRGGAVDGFIGILPRPSVPPCRSQIRLLVLSCLLPSMGQRTAGARALATLVALLSCVSLSRAFVSGRTRPTTTSGCRHTAVRGQPLPRGRVSVSSRPRSPVVASPPRTPPGLRSTDDDSQGGDGGDGMFGGETI